MLRRGGSGILSDSHRKESVEWELFHHTEDREYTYTSKVNYYCSKLLGWTVTETALDGNEIGTDYIGQA